MIEQKEQEIAYDVPLHELRRGKWLHEPQSHKIRAGLADPILKAPPSYFDQTITEDKELAKE